LTGAGVTAPQHQVQLSWGASSSSGVTGYNVYRGGVSGGPYTKINSALVVGTNYSDSSVQAGKTYFYVTTALNGSGTESAYSNGVQATVPSP
jgi:fibronectin type 3 domain-containing protein